METSLNVQTGSEASARALCRDVVRAFPTPTRLYARIRLELIRRTILPTLARLLPPHGTVIDLGCGVGLTTLYLAAQRTDLAFVGLDRNRRRIERAQAAATALNRSNVRFLCRDAHSPLPDSPSCVMAVDLLHHIAPEGTLSILTDVRNALSPGGLILIKEVDASPWIGSALCRLTDLISSPGQAVYYRPVQAWADMLASAGFIGTRIERIRDTLPYPHTLLISSAPPT